jgi:4-amino-4-deoxy-L-arabinose transferase-like glycosyltransferase
MNRKRWRFWLGTGTALLAGLLFRLWFVHHMALVIGDSLMYGDIAKNLLRHGIYGFSQGSTRPDRFAISPTLIRLPGYPLFLAGCFRLFGMEHYNAVLYTQAIVDLITCCLVSALVRRIFSKGAALVVLWLAALCPFTASYVAIALCETLVLATIALAFYGFARWQEAGRGYNGWLWIIAVALACSILLRPEQTLFASAVIFAMLWLSLKRGRVGVARSALPVLATALCVVLPLVPWAARNWRTFHVFQPLVPKYANDPGELAPLGFSRWYRTWSIEFADTENVYWNYPGDYINFDSLPQRAFNVGSQSASDNLHDHTAALFADYNAGVGHSQEVNPRIDARFNALGQERIRAHPVLYYAGLPVARVLDMMLRPRTEMMDVPLDWSKWHEHPRPSAFAGSYAALNLAYIVAGVAGFFTWKRRAWLSFGLPQDSYRELAFAMAASLILRVALLLTIDNSEPRYTLEFFPVLFVWAGALFAKPQSPARIAEHGGR